MFVNYEIICIINSYLNNQALQIVNFKNKTHYHVLSLDTKSNCSHYFDYTLRKFQFDLLSEISAPLTYDRELAAPFKVFLKRK